MDEKGLESHHSPQAIGLAELSPSIEKGFRMSDIRDYDVVVVGGGPAGSTTAALLAKNGRNVMLLEREKFPRYHIGESMITGVIPALEELGLIDELDKRFQPKYGISLVWGLDSEPWRASFDQTGRYDHSWHVIRSEFDELLLDTARGFGVHVEEQAHVTAVLSDENGTVTGVTYRRGGETFHVTSRFVVDASGQARAVSRKLTEVSWQEDLRNVAIWNYFTPYVPLSDGRQGGDILVESVKTGGWIWGIPVAEDKLSLGHVLPATLVAEAAAQGLSHQGLFDRAVENSEVAKTMIANGAPVDKLRTARDWSHVCRSFHGPGWLSVGDAAGFIDPLFSQGVWLGTSGAWMAARALEAALKNPADTERALDRYELVYRVLYDEFLSFIRFFYDPNKLREIYLQRAQQDVWHPDGNLKVGFITLISGIKALPNITGFDPLGTDLPKTVRM